MQVALDVRGETFAEELFHAYDRTGSGFVSAEQLVEALLALRDGTLEERTALTFWLVAGEAKTLSFAQLVDVLQVRPAQAVNAFTWIARYHCGRRELQHPALVMKA